MVVRVDVTGADKEHLSSVPQHECSSMHTHAHSGTILESTYRPLSRSQGSRLNLRLIKINLRETPSQLIRPHLIRGITQGKTAGPMGLAAVSSDQPILLFMHGKLVIKLILGANSDAADRESVVPVVVVRGVDSVRTEVQGVGVVVIVAIVANRGPVVAVVACVAQEVAWIDAAAPDKHQRRLHNSIRIS